MTNGATAVCNSLSERVPFEAPGTSAPVDVRQTPDKRLTGTKLETRRWCCERPPGEHPGARQRLRRTSAHMRTFVEVLRDMPPNSPRARQDILLSLQLAPRR